MQCKGLALCAAVLAFPFLDLLTEHTAEALHIPTRCKCLKTISLVRRRQIKTFSVTEKGSHCPVTELVLHLKGRNMPSSQCLDPFEKQGKQLLACWKRIKKNESKKNECIKRKRQRTKESKNKILNKQTKKKRNQKKNK
ncbi:growth-regulated alpha protein-like [Lissotriton helveticus]